MYCEVILWNGTPGDLPLRIKDLKEIEKKAKGIFEGQIGKKLDFSLLNQGDD